MKRQCPLINGGCYGVDCMIWHRDAGCCGLLASVGAVEGLMTELGRIRENLRDLVKVVAANG